VDLSALLDVPEVLDLGGVLQKDRLGRFFRRSGLDETRLDRPFREGLREGFLEAVGVELPNELRFLVTVAAREKLQGKTTVRLVRLPPGLEPDQLTAKALKWLVAGLQVLDLQDLSFSFREAPVVKPS
jgi:hypothetical protein